MQERSGLYPGNDIYMMTLADKFSRQPVRNFAATAAQGRKLVAKHQNFQISANFAGPRHVVVLQTAMIVNQRISRS